MPNHTCNRRQWLASLSAAGLLTAPGSGEASGRPAASPELAQKGQPPTPTPGGLREWLQALAFRQLDARREDVGHISTAAQAEARAKHSP